MDVYDTLAVQKVWQRVGLAQKEKTCQGTLTGELLQKLIAQEWADCRTYHALAASAQGCTAAALRRISQQEADHARQLQAVYFILTGKQAPRCCAARKKLCCNIAILRQRVGDEQEGAQTYHQIADQAGPYAMLFSCLARDEESHAAVLLRLLACRM